jgi:hypothetical protein
MTIKLIRDKETKNTIRFNSGAGDISGCIYINKSNPLSSEKEIVLDVGTATVEAS